ncbi:MAG: hypothetical protein ACI4Q9_01700 [Candidatus Methanomethylophilaceae archaeon]
MKIDLLELQKQGIISGDIDRMELEYKDSIASIRILNFIAGNNGSPIAYIAKKVVLPEWSYAGMVEPGDIWFCVVKEKDTCYVAYPFKKVTAAIYSELDTESIRILVEALYNSNRQLMDQRMKELAMEEAITKVAEDMNKSLRGEIDALKSEIDRLNNENSMLRSLSDCNASEDHIILTSEETDPIPEVCEAEHVPVTVEAPNAEPAPAEVPVIPYIYNAPAPGLPSMGVSEPVRDSELTGYEVRLLPGYRIYSPSFTENRYFVHISYNKRYMLVRPHNKGSVICMNNHNYLIISDLRDIIKDGPAVLNAEYNRKYGGLLIDLSSVLQDTTMTLDVMTGFNDE